MRTIIRMAVAAAVCVALLLGGAIIAVRDGVAPVRDAVGDVRVDGSFPVGTIVPTASLDAVIPALQDRVRAVPGDAGAFARLGIAYIAQARVTADPSWYPKADEALERSFEIQADGNVGALLGKGTLALARHDFAGALRLGRVAARLDPFDADVDGVIGDALVELGRYDRAFRTFQRMVDRRPGLASYARVSYARELLGDVSGAVDAMRMAFDAAGSGADRAWTAFQLGELEWSRGRVASARHWYARGLQLEPRFVPNEAGLAKVAFARGETAEAIERWLDVVERYPSVEYVSALGDAYASIGEPELAAERYSVVDAIRRLQRANGVDVDLEIALFDAEHGSPTRALAAARSEWARRRSVHVADAFAWALYVNGRYERARRLASRALALGTRNALFSFHAGMIERALGNDDEALRLLREALDINPHFSILHAPLAERIVERLGGAR